MRPCLLPLRRVEPPAGTRPRDSALPVTLILDFCRLNLIHVILGLRRVTRPSQGRDRGAACGRPASRLSPVPTSAAKVRRPPPRHTPSTFRAAGAPRYIPRSQPARHTGSCVSPPPPSRPLCSARSPSQSCRHRPSEEKRERGGNVENLENRAIPTIQAK